MILLYFFRKRIISQYKKLGKTIYTKRDILFTRRLNNYFFVIIQFIFISIIALFLADWSEYYLYSFITDNPYYANTVAQPYSYLLDITGFILYLAYFLSIKMVLFFKSYSRLDITKESLNLVGGSWKEFNKDDILTIEIVPWSFDKIKKIQGMSPLFWKPLIQLKIKENESIYLRTNNAEHLKEDLDNWRNNY